MRDLKFDCEICNNKGWIKTTVYGSQRINDNSKVVEKCDECEMFSSDREAAKFAYNSENVLTFLNSSGFNVLLNFSEN